MIKHLVAKIKKLERQLQQQQPSRGVGVFTSRTTRGVTRRPSAKSTGGGSGEARWA